jgi:hypothetical protein
MIGLRHISGHVFSGIADFPGEGIPNSADMEWAWTNPKGLFHIRLLAIMIISLRPL